METSYNSNYNTLDKIRIYRSNAGNNAAAFQFVNEINVSATYTDDVADTALGEVISSTDFDLPPVDLFNLLDAGNGMLVGFSGDNEICFSEPYQPHAWPIKYRKKIVDTIIGGGIFGSTVVVCTDNFPVLYVGNHPSAMTMTVHPEHQACSSATSIVSTRGAVVFASPNGLYKIGYGGSGILTEPLFDYEKWQERQPTLLRSSHWGTRYVGFVDAQEQGIMFENANNLLAATDFNFKADALYVDPDVDRLYFCSLEDGVNKIYAFHVGGQRIPYKWRSKKLSIGSLATLTAGKILAKYDEILTQEEIDALNALIAAIEAANAALVASGNLHGQINSIEFNGGTINDSDIETPPSAPATQNVVLTLYGENGDLIGSAAANSDKPFRLPSGYRSREFEIEIESFTDVNTITLASSIQDLHD